MNKLTNVNIENLTMLPSPAQVCSELPIALDSASRVIESRQVVKDILTGRDPRHMIIVGPCSIHEPAAAIEYAKQLKKISDEMRDRIYIVMRA